MFAYMKPLAIIVGGFVSEKMGIHFCQPFIITLLKFS
jgi:hypothetical protein